MKRTVLAVIGMTLTSVINGCHTEHSSAEFECAARMMALRDAVLVELQGTDDVMMAVGRVRAAGVASMGCDECGRQYGINPNVNDWFAGSESPLIVCLCRHSPVDNRDGNYYCCCSNRTIGVIRSDCLPKALILDSE